MPSELVGCLADDFDGTTLGPQWTPAGGDGECALSGAGTLVCRNAGNGAHIRTTEILIAPLTIGGSLDKTDDCSDQYIKVSPRALIQVTPMALCNAKGATLDDLREAATTLEETERTARRVLGGAHPLTGGIEQSLQYAQARLRARETPSPGSA